MMAGLPEAWRGSELAEKTGGVGRPLRGSLPTPYTPLLSSLSFSIFMLAVWLRNSAVAVFLVTCGVFRGILAPTLF